MGFIKWLEGLADNEFNKKQPKIGIGQAQALGRKANLNGENNESYIKSFEKMHAELDEQRKTLYDKYEKEREDRKIKREERLKELTKKWETARDSITAPKVKYLIMKASVKGEKALSPFELYILTQMYYIKPRIVKLPSNGMYSCFTVFGADKKRYYISTGATPEKAYEMWMALKVEVKYMSPEIAMISIM